MHSIAAVLLHRLLSGNYTFVVELENALANPVDDGRLITGGNHGSELGFERLKLIHGRMARLVIRTLRLERLSGQRLPTSLALSNHRCALAASGDAVFVARKDLLACPMDDGSGVFRTLELFYKLRFELFDVCHGVWVAGDLRARPGLWCVAQEKLLFFEPTLTFGRGGRKGKNRRGKNHQPKGFRVFELRQRCCFIFLDVLAAKSVLDALGSYQSML